MAAMTIGEFATRSRLSAKALRLYDRLGLLTPARVDRTNGYRFYCEHQLADAELIALLRRIDMPLATIRDVIGADRDHALSIVTHYWAGVTTRQAERGALVAYLRARLTGAPPTMHDIRTRSVATRDIVSISEHVHLADTPAFFEAAFAALRATGPGLAGIEGLPYLVFYGEVSADSDGPLELCRPVATAVDEIDVVDVGPRLRRHTEAAHDEVFVRLATREMGWPTMLPVVDALDAWVTEHGRRPAGPLRQVLIADQRSAAADTPVCDLTIPLQPVGPTR